MSWRQAAVSHFSGAPYLSPRYIRASVVDAIGEIIAAFELVDDRNVHAPDFSNNILSFIGDNAWNAALVRGNAVANWR